MSNIDDMDRLELKQLLAKLQNEHASLDQEVALKAATPGVDQIAISRLKRRKLNLKDMITKLKSGVLPDLPA